jgi:arginase
VTPESKSSTAPAQTKRAIKIQAQPSKASARRTENAVSLIYVPLHLGGSHRGVSMGPAAMKVAELSARVERFGFRVAEEIDIAVPISVCWGATKTTTAKCVPEILQVSQDVARAVENALDKGIIPITIGGDHSLAIGSIAGVANYFRRIKEAFGLVWFDAHGDINTPDTTRSGNVHGMPLAVSLGHGDPRLTELCGYSPKIPGSRSALIGIRDIDIAERAIIEQTGITPFTMRDIDHLGLGRVTDLAIGAVGFDVSGIHVSFDIDSIDPDVAPGVSTHARGGLNYREAILALTLLAESQMITSIDICELNPANDVRNQTAELAVDLILACLGNSIL